MRNTKTKILTASLALLLTTTTFTTANSSSSERSHYQSCISLTTNFDQLKKQNHQFSAKEQLTFQTSNLPESQNYIITYQKASNTLILFQSPFNSQKQSLNINTTKALAKLKLPNKRKNIQYFILQEKRLFITGEENNQSTILIYTIENNRIKPFQTYYSTGKIKHIALARENLFFISEMPLNQNNFDRLYKTQGEDATILPKVEKSLKFGLSKTLLDQAQCKKISYHFPQTQGGSFFTFLNFQINDLQQSPKINYFLGNLQEITFAQDYFYLLSSAAQQLQLARFFRDPKLQLQTIQTLTGNFLPEQTSTTQKNLLQFIYQDENKQTQLASWNEKEIKKLTFPKAQNPDINYQKAIFGNKSIKLRAPQNHSFHLFPLSAERLQTPHTIKINKNQDFLLEIENMDQLQSLQKILSQKADQIQDQRRSSNENLLFLLLKTPDQKTLLEVYQINPQTPSKLLFKRDYSKLNTNLSFQSIKNNALRIAIDFGTHLDCFLFSNPKATKTFRL